MLEPVVSLVVVTANSRLVVDFNNNIARRLLLAVPAIASRSTAYPHGRCYATATVFRNNQAIAKIWAGYLLDDGSAIVDVSPMSYPDLELKNADVIEFNCVFGSNAVAGDNIQLLCDFGTTTPNVPSHPNNYYEAPGSGDGELYQTAFVQPAAAADFANVQVPSFVRWKFVSVGAQLTTSGVANNRFWIIEFKKATIVFFRSCAGGTQPASAASTGWSGFIGGAPAAVDQVSLAAANQYSFGLPNTKLAAGDIIQFVTANFGAGDQWDPNSIDGYFVEEWATPSP